MLKVQVVVTTFNHAKYLAQTFDSILAQETRHKFQILVHDDASTDGTRDIIQDYASRHPEVFNCILQEENQFQQGHRIAKLVWPHYTAQYVAYLDGDDFWTRTDKLQRQVDFMDAHPRCMISQTRSVFFDNETGEVLEHFPPEDKRRRRRYFEDLAPANFLLSSAVMHRRDALPELPPDFSEIGFGDYAKFALIARKGWIGYLDIEATRYRIHKKNMWYGKPYEERLKKTQDVQGYVARYAPKPFDAVWEAASRGTLPVRSKVRRACKRARLLRIAGDEFRGFVPKTVFTIRQMLGLRH
ncbi:glycosyltransferase [Roseovarius sp. CAU 1744]|uniref:glycosyltransferase n=1 Tax=Roseovarius sp. CAU 1744 TaxID=3140368 RepID=UPI00325BFE18